MQGTGLAQAAAIELNAVTGSIYMQAKPMTTQDAVLAGGCFWGMEELFRALPGVVATRVGYSGGHTKNPIYRDLHGGATGHAEALKITFDPARISYEELLEFFFQIHDPTTMNRQGNDVGTQYRSAIFYANDEQRQVGENVVRKVEASGKWPGKIVTEIVAAKPFYDAEDYHQDYLRKNPGGYTCHWIRPNWALDK
jgi:peptide-methionine (S)-S-oxide reductase